MERHHVLLVVFLLVSLADDSSGWLGNHYVARTDTYYVYHRTCRNWVCWSYRTVSEPRYRDVTQCCPGWTTSSSENCNIPVCNPPCKNGGTCVAPSQGSCAVRRYSCTCPRNVCRCPVQHSGVDCANSLCSHQAPCYPGTCIGTDGCDCARGFRTTGSKRDYCLTIEYEKETQLTINQMNVRMSYWPRDSATQHEKFFVLADSTDLKNNSMDFLWTKLRDFNRLETTCSSQFFVSNLPQKPPYIGEAKFGIIQAEMEVWLSKLRPGGGRFDSVKNTTFPCPSPVVARSPRVGTYPCNIQKTDFDRTLEHGDFLRVTYKTKGGGYREVLDLNTNPPPTTVQFYKGPFQTLSVEFRFDFKEPTHCGETGTCSRNESMLTFADVSRTSPVSMTWDGWTDADSGMFSYTLEVFKMTQAFPGELQIRKADQLHPVEKREVLEADLKSQVYTPPHPGLFSVVLGASDLANNTNYVRRLLLFDPASDVTLDPGHDLFVSTASAAANYSYQSNVTSAVDVQWGAHFRNAFLEENGLLGKVLDFPILPENPEQTIERSSLFDDHEGARTVDPVPNDRGIVNFQVAFKRDTDGGLKQPLVPSFPASSWTNLDLQTNYTVLDKPSEGSTFTIWVKATDALGNVKVDRTQVSFDDTPPDVEKFEFDMNSPAENIHFASRFQLTAKDRESGIAFVAWTFQRENGSVVYQETVEGKSASYESCSSQFSTCECTPSRACFVFDQSFAFSNCHVMIEKERLEMEVINVTADVTNMAGLVNAQHFTITNLTSLNGTRAYYPPQDIKVIGITDNSVTLTWVFPPSCFRRTELWVEVNGGRRAVHKNAVEFDLTGLEPETAYTVFMIAGYEGGESSDRAAVTFTTNEAALSVALIAGVTAGSLIVVFLVLFILVFVLWRRGLVFQQPGRINNQLARMNSIYSTFNPSSRKSAHRKKTRQTLRPRQAAPSAAYHNNAYKPDEAEEDPDELYLYGEMTFESRQPWQHNESSLTLMDHVTRGKFANIYKARLNTGSGPSRIVAAKMLKPAYKEDDMLKMTAKINFFATQLGDHPNVLAFVGAVLDNKNWGPVLVTELCEGGQMDKWLVSHKGQVEADTLDTLRDFAAGITDGMAYLAGKQILHRRLAARNVLLTDTLQVKVAGFGPQEKDVDEKKQTRIPAKWAAPEILRDERHTEKSDVWSYGVVLWEIFSMGQVPYPGIHSKEIGAKLKGGYRMEKPEYADNTYYNIMRTCWAEEPEGRPTFNNLCSQLGTDHYDVNYYDVNQLKS